MFLSSNKLIKLFLLLSFTTMTSASAKNVNIEEISENLAVIQIAAFKKSKALLHKNDLLYTFDICTISDREFHRVFVVNIKKDQFKKVLFLTKKIYPDAFSADEKLHDLLKNKREKMMQKKILLSRKSLYHDDLLNARSILQTHRNFF